MTPARPPAPIRTPCRLICSIDTRSGLCIGCYRTREEIAGWSRLSDAERERLMIELPPRREQIAVLRGLDPG